MSITPDVDGSYTLQLIVNDGLDDSEPDEVVLLASPTNVPPNAVTGLSQNVLTGSTVTLDGAKSQDPDNGPNALTFQWSFVQVPVGSGLQDANITNATQAAASFVPDVSGQYELDLTIFDGATNDQAQVFITAFDIEVPPNADAGEDQMLTIGSDALLNGSSSNDPDNNPNALTFDWQFVSTPAGSSLTNAGVLDPQTATPRFTPDVEGAYVLRLQVSDGGAIDADNVMVVIEPEPICIPAPDPDINDDGIVNISDISMIASCFGHDPQNGPHPHCPLTDVYCDGDVDFDDYNFVLSGFGQTF